MYRRSYYGGYGGFGSINMFVRDLEREREREERERLREMQRFAAGSRRREVELASLGRFTPAGEWDADCEKWPEKTYTWSIGDFKMEINRNFAAWTWCGYVTLPEGYPRREKSYDYWNGTGAEGYMSGLPKPPVRELTYSEGGKFGFDHTWGQDRQPFAKAGFAGNHSGCTYTTAEMAIKEVWRLAAYFAYLVLDGTLPTSAEWMAQHKESLLKIVEHDMRRVYKKRKEEERLIFEALRIAAEKAAEEARLAAELAAETARKQAEAAERQRLWDEAHPEEAAIRKAEERAAAAAKAADSAVAVVRDIEAKAAEATRDLREAKEKARHAEDKIREAVHLIAEEARGCELTSRQRRLINHRPQLEVELKNRLARIEELEKVPVEDFTARIAAAEAAAAEAKSAADAAGVEVTALKEAWAAKQRAVEEARVAAEKEAAAAAEREARRAPLLKRLPNVKKLLAEIEVLRQRRAAGETLDPLQGKKMGRRQALEKELAEIEKELAD
jgi:hypothetical protein